jgi:hypothetical protein
MIQRSPCGGPSSLGRTALLAFPARAGAVGSFEKFSNLLSTSPILASIARDRDHYPRMSGLL